MFYVLVKIDWCVIKRLKKSGGEIPSNRNKTTYCLIVYFLPQMGPFNDSVSALNLVKINIYVRLIKKILELKLSRFS